ncbi:hypothetical protein GCM10027321_20840 [Massilia terrae]|uniref:Glycosyltransferase n=1 Tax=Massilia terrae TaxID=1811224 RepID=A0ABT2CXS6_9BURK|nr:glycosyltransferase [Massilia terrae]MCS0657908.1 glycosyltransferase [Massilia terrae]
MRRLRVLQLGRMVPRNGVDTVIQGVALLRGRHRIDAELLVVGGDIDHPHGRDNVEMARVRALAGQLEVSAHLRFTGQKARSELRYYYSAADAFVTTPWYAPVGITPVEAMACARPVIGSEVGGIKCSVADGLTGFLIPPRDPQALAARLATLHGKPGLARAMGERALRRAYQHFTWRIVAQQAAAIYAAVLQEQQVANYQPQESA